MVKLIFEIEIEISEIENIISKVKNKLLEEFEENDIELNIKQNKLFFKITSNKSLEESLLSLDRIIVYLRDDLKVE
ncbi:MAG: hypothetical protein ACTSQY_07620 [Candidatus Odinarchaeia archaeon]